MRLLTTNSIILALGTYAAQAAALVMYSFAARALGPSRFGPLLGLIGIVVVLSTFADFGLNTWTVRALARDQSDTKPFASSLSAKALISLVLGIAWIFASFGLAHGLEKGLAPAILGVYLSLSIIETTLVVPLRAAERMGAVALVTTFDKVVALSFAAVLFAALPASPELLSYSLVGGALAGCALGGALALPYIHEIALPSVTATIALWKDSMGIGLVGVASQIQRADVAVVSFVAGPATAGLYGAPARLTPLLGVIPASFAAALFPQAAGDPDSDEGHDNFIVGIAAMLSVMLIVLSLAYLLAPFAVQFLLGSTYSGSVPVLRIFCFAMLASSISQPLALLLLAKSHDRYVALVVLSGAVLGLAAVAAGAALGQARGAALGVVVMQIYLLALLASRSLTVMRARVSALRRPGT